ncbi:MAG: N-acyl-phosphatidylethanolamine-hydrolyzing phospholipase D [Paraglaciecola psychrophila]|jgi:N-acyl-phosphatidylethanolamine-hydrolysing phospholipase D
MNTINCSSAHAARGVLGHRLWSISWLSLLLSLSMSLLLITVPSLAKGESGLEPLFEPAPRAADGRFVNGAGDIAHGSFKDRIPFMLRRFGGMLRSSADAPRLVANNGALLRANTSQSTATWIGHATVLVQMQGATFLTDPIWSNTPSPIPFVGPRRYVPPGMALADLPVIDFVLISHNHYDHLDLPTLRKLAKRNPKAVFFVPLGNGELLRKQGIEQVQELDWGDTVQLAGLTIYCLPSQHWSKRSLRDDHRALWSSWAVTGPQRRFYFAGDSGYFDGFKTIGEKLGPFDLAALPIGAYQPQAMMRQSHMNPEQAVQAAQDLRADKAMAIHFGTFDLSDEPLAEPPRRFLEAALNSGADSTEAWLFNIGQTRAF